MVRIVSDTSTMYSTAQAREAGFEVSPLSVTIAGKTYREYDEINAERFVDIINEGNMPQSSQPSVGEVAALMKSILTIRYLISLWREDFPVLMRAL